MDRSLKCEMFGGAEKAYNVLGDRELSELAFDLLDVIHEYDRLMLKEITEEQYDKIKKTFKRKWVSNHGVRVKRIVDAAVEDLREELYQTFEVEGKR
ncbi:MAG: hypothetical protein Q4B26_02080 [Eubacteriales bacterium]|nr:hypothetical protein [Eubacteriales bacterium]